MKISKSRIRMNVSGAASIASMAFGVGVLLGWSLEIPLLRSVLPGAVEMKANTALALFLAGAALFLLVYRSSSSFILLAEFLSLLVAALGLGTLGEYVLGWDLGIDELMFRDTADAFNKIPGRMSPYSAIAFGAIGLALAALPVARLRPLVWLSAIPVTLIGAVSVIGYVWNASEIVTDVVLPPVAVNTAVAFIAIGLGILFATQRGSTNLPIGTGTATNVTGELLLGFIAVGLILLFSGGKLYRSIIEYAQAESSVIHTQIVLREVAELYSDISDAESAQRNYMVTGTEAFKRESVANMATTYERLDTLFDLTADNQAQIQRLTELRFFISARFAALEQTTAAFDARGLPGARDVMSTNSGLDRMADVRRLSWKMAEIENDLLIGRQANADRHRAEILGFLIVILIVIVGIFSFLFFHIHKAMEQRARRDLEIQGLNASLEREISERSAALTALEIKEREVSTMVNSLLDCVITMDAQGIIRSVNLAMTETLGYAAEEVVGRNISILMAEPNEKKRNGDLVGYLRDETPHAVGLGRELEMCHKSGERIPFELGVSEFAVGGEQFYVGILHDIRERKQFIGELQQARESAEKATEAKSSFLASMSHEIRTPMNGIVGMIDLLAETPIDDDQRRMVGTIKASAYSLLGIIGDILDFSKLDAGRMLLESFPIAIDEIVDSIGAMQWSDAVKKSIIMPVYCDPRIPDQVFGDSVRIRQILTNLIGNAFKFTRTTPERIGKVIVRADLLAEVMDRVQIRFSVSDNGIGMTDDVTSRLFQPFEQADASTVRQFGGTGLGLSIIKQLTHLMAGEISVESAPGVGSTFSVDIWFDVVESTKQRANLTGVNIIVMGSEAAPESAEFLASYITFLGAHAEIIHTQEQCLKRLAATADTSAKFDIVVVGMRLLPIERRLALRDAALSVKGMESLRVVFLNFEHQASLFVSDSRLLNIPATPTSRETFVKAISIACGRASPGTQSLADTKLLSKLNAPSVEAAEAAGQLILIAEDNETNRDVLARQIAILGYAGVIVDDGRQAFDAYRSGKFALLLTDCHMPEMDGYQLTSAIRADEVGTERHLPIIAITANALHGEAERCLKIGMDDFVVKPVELHSFREKLKKWLPLSVSPGGGASSGEVGARDNASGVEAKPLFDVAALRRLVGDDPDLIGAILGDFEAPSRRIVADIYAAFDERAAASIGFSAHKLKSSARTIGAENLAEMSQLLEQAAKFEDWAVIDKIVPEMMGAFDDVVEYIAAELRKSGHAETGIKPT